MKDDLGKLKEKIAKMLRLAEGEAKNGNDDLAATYMAKIDKMLEEHQIGLHEVRANEERISDPMGQTKGENKVSSTLAWYRLATNAISNYYGCKMVFTTDKKQVHYVLVGRESARVTAELMIPFVISQVKQQTRVYLRKMIAMGYTDMTETKAQTHIGLALVDRIWALIRANAGHKASLVGRGLIPVNDVQAFMDEVFGKLGKRKKSTGTTTGTAREFADKISLHVQTTHDRKRMLT